MAKCPACGKQHSMKLMCSDCWQKVPAKDRVKLGNMFFRNPNNPKTYQSKLDQVVRDLKARQEGGAPCPS